MKRIIIFLIHAYRWLISSLTAPRCRFDPTCSRYAINCIEIHGIGKGLWLTAKRILRCHPYEKLSKHLGSTWGYDPVPPQKAANKAPAASRYHQS